MKHSRFDPVFRELSRIQSRLKSCVNRLWTIKASLAAAQRQGQQVHDFLPRRLSSLRRKEQVEFERLLRQFNRILSSHLDSSLIAFSSVEDVEAVLRIRATIRYIRNAFSAEIPVGRTLAHLNQ